MKLASKAIILLTLLFTLSGGVLTASDAQQQVQFSTPIMVVNSSFLNIRTGPGVKYEVLLTVVGGTELPVLGVAKDRVWYQVSTVIGVGWVNVEFTIPRGEFSNVPVIDTANIIASRPIVSVPTTIGMVDGQGGGGGAPTALGVAPAPVGGTFVAGTDANGNPIIISGANERYRAALAVPAANLRTAPGDYSPALGTLYRDESVDFPIVGNGHDTGNVEWLAVVTPQFGSGWLDAPKLRVRLSGAFHTVMVVTAQTVAMGDGPGTGSSTLPILTEGTEGFLINISQDGHFIQLELGGGEQGWIPFSSAQQRTGTPTDGLQLNPNTIPVADAGQGGGAAPAPSFGLSVPHVVVNTGFLNIRSGPGAQYSTVVTVSGGTELPVLGIAKDRVWYLVQGSFGRGWLNSEFAIFRGVYSNVPVINTDIVVGELSSPVAVISAPIALYAAPGVNFGVIATVAAPAEIAIVARTADSTWVQINTQYGFGWILASQVILRGDLSVVPVVS